MITEPLLGLGWDTGGREKVGADGWDGWENEVNGAGRLGLLLNGLNLLAVLMMLEKNPPCPLTEVIRQRARLTQKSFIVSRLNCWRVEIQLRGGETTPK